MEPLLDKLARQKIPDRFARFVIRLFLPAQDYIRIILIIGAAVCFVAGIKWVYWTTACECPAALPLAILAFVPIILIAPSSATRKPILVIFIVMLETLVIAAGCTLVLR
jgi:hypothetical protein